MSVFRIARHIFTEVMSVNVVCILGKKAKQNGTALQKAIGILTFMKFRRMSKWWNISKIMLLKILIQFSRWGQYVVVQIMENTFLMVKDFGFVKNSLIFQTQYIL